MRLFRRLAYTWLFNLLALWVAAEAISGIGYSNHVGTLVLAAFVFAAVNLFLKPVAKVFAFPAILLTLGIALFFINILMLYVTHWIVTGFEIANFWAAVWATVLIWAVNWALQIVFDVDDRSSKRRSSRAART